VLLPVVGLMLNGTSSVLYGTVPELAPSGRTERGFAIFYTGTIGAGAIAPILFGMLGDAVGSHGAMMATAITAAAILPLAIALAPRLSARASARRDWRALQMVTARVRNAGRDHVAIADRLDLLKAMARDNAIKARE
jgi:predicted MFS family arabinose efflux permease